MSNTSERGVVNPSDNSPDPRLPTTGSSTTTLAQDHNPPKDLAAPEPENHENQSDTEKQKPAPPAIDPSAFPDGGLQAWMVVFGGFCGLFVSFGWINCIGVFQTQYQQNQLSEYSSSTISWIPSLETGMMFAVSPICGKIFDNFGPRYLLIVGSFLHVFGLFMTSLATEYYQFILAQGICSPIGAGAIFYGCLNTTSTWFLKKRAFALGITASGSSIGGVIFPIMVERLIPRVGFGWAMRICAFLVLAMCIVVNIFVQPRIPPSRKPFRFMDFITPFKEAPFVLLTGGAFLFFFGVFLPFTFIILHAQRYGMSPHLASYLVPILNAASTFGRTFPGWIADRVGRFNMMIIVTYFTSILILAFWIPARGNAAVIVFTALYGFSSGAFVSLPPALVAQISDVREIGVRTGTMFATAAIGALTGNPIGGALVPDVENGSFWRMQLFAGMVMAGGSTLFLLARVKLVGVGLMKKF